MLAGILVIAGGFRKGQEKRTLLRNTDFWFVFLLSLAGTVPLMLTLVQKSFYFIHALPFFAISLALFSGQSLSNLTERWKVSSITFRVFRMGIFAGLLTVVIISGSRYGKKERDVEMLHDVHLLGDMFPAWSSIGIDSSMYKDFEMQCYLVRFYNITLDPYENKPGMLLLEKNMAPPSAEEYRKIDVPLELYHLYGKRDNPEGSND